MPRVRFDGPDITKAIKDQNIDHLRQATRTNLNSFTSYHLLLACQILQEHSNFLIYLLIECLGRQSHQFTSHMPDEEIIKILPFIPDGSIWTNYYSQIIEFNNWNLSSLHHIESAARDVITPKMRSLDSRELFSILAASGNLDLIQRNVSDNFALSPYTVGRLIGIKAYNALNWLYDNRYITPQSIVNQDQTNDRSILAFLERVRSIPSRRPIARSPSPSPDYGGSPPSEGSPQSPIISPGSPSTPRRPTISRNRPIQEDNNWLSLTIQRLNRETEEIQARRDRGEFDEFDEFEPDFEDPDGYAIPSTVRHNREFMSQVDSQTPVILSVRDEDGQLWIDPTTREPIEPGDLYLKCVGNHPTKLDSLRGFCQANSGICSRCTICRRNIKPDVYQNI